LAILEEPVKATQPMRNYVGGDWVESDGRLEDIVNPASQKVIGQVPISTREELDSAVVAAQEAFPDWRRTPPLARARVLFRLKELMEQHFEELSRIQTVEHGKIIDESRGETRRGIENVEVATGAPTLMMGYNLEDISADIDEYVINQPVGVFGIIGPFNFPLMVPLWFIPYAIATGNCVIVKPSSEDPSSQAKVAELAEEAGLPPGVLNIVHGGREVTNSMLENRDIKGIGFVGSTSVGRDVVYRKCGETGKRVIAGCGAKNAVLVMPDVRLDRVMPALMTSFYGNTGQRCLAGENLMVVGEGLSDGDFEAFYHRVTEEFTAAASKIRVGYGLDESVQMGPLRDKKKKENVVGFIEKGVEEGAKLRLDGRNLKLPADLPPDAFLNPTVFTEGSIEMAIGKEEIFGPVANIVRARNLDQAIDMVEKSAYGNAASIFTNNGRWARELQYRANAGNIGVNIGLPAPIAMFPFGGMKDSFFGSLHPQGKDAIRFFTETKVVIQRWM
jgi:malonate-semialdehyde dehydrogenase (acetylating) / methylmalonate-semialdehyde dehydrogenase